jgi:hypothetical protein
VINPQSQNPSGQSYAMATLLNVDLHGSGCGLRMRAGLLAARTAGLRGLREYQLPFSTTNASAYRLPTCTKCFVA